MLLHKKGGTCFWLCCTRECRGGTAESLSVRILFLSITADRKRVDIDGWGVYGGFFFLMGKNRNEAVQLQGRSLCRVYLAMIHRSDRTLLPTYSQESKLTSSPELRSLIFQAS